MVRFIKKKKWKPKKRSAKRKRNSKSKDSLNGCLSVPVAAHHFLVQNPYSISSNSDIEYGKSNKSSFILWQTWLGAAFFASLERYSCIDWTTKKRPRINLICSASPPSTKTHVRFSLSLINSLLGLGTAFHALQAHRLWKAICLCRCRSLTHFSNLFLWVWSHLNFALMIVWLISFC